MINHHFGHVSGTCYKCGQSEEGATRECTVPSDTIVVNGTEITTHHSDILREAFEYRGFMVEERKP